MLAHLALTFQHRAGVSPYTSTYVLAETCVFDKQSLLPGLCHPKKVAFNWVFLIPKLRKQFAEFLQHHSLKRLGILYRYTCVRFGYGLMVELFLGTHSRQLQSNKELQFTESVTSTWFRNICLIPIDYGFRPRLRGRLTLRRLALRRNPCTLGDRVFHSVCRYSCQHSHFWYLQKPSRVFLQRLTERSATRYKIRKFYKFTTSVRNLSPVTSSAQSLLIRPVSCYAIFKGWLLLSQPPGCFGVFTSFHT